MTTEHAEPGTAHVTEPSSSDVATTIALLREALMSPESIHPGLAGHILDQLDRLEDDRNDCCSESASAVA